MTIDLSGPDGNAYMLMATAHSLCGQLDRRSESEGIVKAMMSGDYANLIEVFEEHFGHVVTLENKPGDEEDM